MQRYCSVYIFYLCRPEQKRSMEAILRRMKKSDEEEENETHVFSDLEEEKEQHRDNEELGLADRIQGMDLGDIF